MGASNSTKRYEHLRQRIYRAGYPFTAGELVAMQAEGLLRHVAQDVYAEAGLPEGPALRAAAAYALLNRRLRESGTLCGETAAWVHLGGQAPQRVQVMVSGTSAAQRAVLTGRWRLHYLPLQAADAEPMGAAAVTTALRTAADLFCGIGVTHFPRALDRAPAWQRTENLLLHWPAARDPLQGRDEDLCAPGPQETQAVQQRWQSIAALMDCSGADPDETADAVLSILSRTRWDSARRQQILELLTQCVSRRLPTVR